jgi:hypothetical protein
MPGSQQDRPTTSHEHVFLLSKNKRYFYDNEAIREPPAGYSRKGGSAPYTANGSATHGIGSDSLHQMAANGRTVRTVWTINPGSYAGAHFATFPPALVEPMIKAGTSAKGCCPECGAPWERVTDRKGSPSLAVGGMDPQGVGSLRDENGKIHWGDQHPDKNPERWKPTVTTTGWTPTCSHYDALYYSDFPKPKSARKWSQRARSGNWFKRVRKRPGLAHWPVEPCTVLDPFAGTFTTGLEAVILGRRAVGIELSKDYCDEHIIPRLGKDLQMELL